MTQSNQDSDSQASHNQDSQNRASHNQVSDEQVTDSKNDEHHTQTEEHSEQLDNPKNDNNIQKSKAKFTVFKNKTAPSFAPTSIAPTSTADSESSGAESNSQLKSKSKPHFTDEHPKNDQKNIEQSTEQKTEQDANKPVKEVVEQNVEHTRQTATQPTPESSTQPKKKSSLLKRISQIFVISLMVLLILLVVMFQTLFGKMQQPSQFIDIEDGQTYYGFINEWKEQIPLFSSSIAKLYIKFQVDKPLHAGTYQLPENPTMPQILNILQQGSEVALVRVQIIEGKTAKDLYSTLKATNGINIEVLTDETIKDKTLKKTLGIDAKTPKGKYADNLEGWFAPDTYFFAEESSDKDVLVKLYNRQYDLLHKAWENRADNLPYLTSYDALIMASIIEKETGLAEERDKVASVFVNRLRKGMKLQTDPTIIYGMGERYDGNIRKKDIKEKTDYNTYQINGLPPTPIALPSAASIEAALHPADTEYVYFVATGHGGHKFSKTLKEHNQAVQEYLKVTRGQ